MALDERAFFTDRNETRPARYTCNRCRRTNDYTVRWVRRVKKDRLPPGADERDRAKFAKLRDHLIRVDDEVICKSCGKKIEIPSLHSLLFVDQLEGLPRDVDEDEAAPSAPAPAAGTAAPASARANTPQRPPQAQGRPGPDRPAHDRPSEDRPSADRQPHDRSRGPRRLNSPSRGWR